MFVAVALTLCMSVALLVQTAYSQEITYNLTPTHKLGDEIWRIPIGGRLTMSADGSKMLVASIADSAFFVVNTANGEYRKLKARYYRNNDSGFTYYVVDKDLALLMEGGSNAPPGDRLWSIVDDTLITELPSIGPIRALSSELTQIASIGGTFNYHTNEQIASFQLGGGTSVWFDEAKQRCYAAYDRVLVEFNAVNGNELRRWQIRPLYSVIRRPSNSDWIYVFSIRTEGFDTRNLVEAINLVTEERIVFTDYYWSGGGDQPEYRDGFAFFSASSESCFSRGLDYSLSGSHDNAIFEFSADSKETDVVLDEEIRFLNQKESKILALTPQKDFLFHTWFVGGGDSSHIVCQALIPNTVSFTGEEPGATDPQIRVAQTPSELHVSLTARSPETIIQNITLITTAGQTVVSMPVQQQTEPFVVPIAHVANGAYVLVLQTSQGQISTTIFIER